MWQREQVLKLHGKVEVVEIRTEFKIGFKIKLKSMQDSDESGCSVTRLLIREGGWGSSGQSPMKMAGLGCVGKTKLALQF